MSTFQVDLRGMVDLLSRNLYSGPRVYLRELLQNAVDAIAARRALDPRAPAHVTLTVGDGTLSCRDTGIGLTPEEVASLLSTIGASSKRDELGLARGDFLGQFGIGLLSCFMVSPEIEVRSRSAVNDAAPTVQWLGRTDGTYAVTTADQDPEMAPMSSPGSLVTLRALPGEPWLEADTVRALVEEFGSLLPVRIEVRDRASTTVHGQGEGPWEMPRGRAVAWCTRELGAEPFDLIDLDVPAAGLHGVAAVMPTAQPTRSAHHTVYVKRMLVSRAANDLAPEWAFFVRIVAEAPYLHLTASREALVDDDLLGTVREAIGQAVRTWLTRLARTAPTRLARFIEAHAVGLCAVAVDDPEVLGLVAEHVPLTTTLGRRTPAQLAALVREGRRVRYTRTVDQFRGLADVASSQGIVLVNAGHSYETELLQALALHPEVLGEGTAPSLVDPGELLDALAPVSPAEQAEAAEVLLLAEAAMKDVECEVVLRRFEPGTLPALYLPDPDLAGRRAARSSAAIASGAWAQVLGVTDPFATTPRPRLVLNRANPLVTRLIAAAGCRGSRGGDEALTRVLRGLYVQCLLTGHYTLGPKERSWAAQTLWALLSDAVPDDGPPPGQSRAHDSTST